MHRFTSQLALIAYLIGGWLLPAAHHHGHEHAASGGSCGCHSVGWDESGSACLVEAGVGEHTNEHGRDHDGCWVHHAETLDGETPASIAGVASAHVAGDWVAGESPGSDCVGLCALCCAVSLVGHVTAGMTTDTAPVVQAGQLAHTGLAWPLLPLPGSLSSRGPPAV